MLKNNQNLLVLFPFAFYCMIFYVYFWLREEENELPKKLIIHPPKIPSAHDMDSFQTVVSLRRDQMLCQCNNMALASQKKKSWGSYSHLYVFPHENIVYCPVYKASTSTWRRNLLMLSYLPQDEKLELLKKRRREQNRKLKRMRKVTRTESAYKEFLKQNPRPKSFIVVRHPFTRLVSAYRDKIETLGSGEYYQESHGRTMVSKYRTEARKRFGDDFFSAENNFGSPMKSLREWMCLQFP